MKLSDNFKGLAEHWFGVEIPVSSIELKKAYRRRCIELHPDTGGDEALFKEMHAAYYELTKLGSIADVFNDEEYKKYTETSNGIPLSKLGLGLGPTINGSDCPECNHKGYYEHTQRFGSPCTKCSGSGVAPLESECKACKGTGKFTQARSRRVVDCRVCGGSGIYRRRRRSIFERQPPCQECGGTGAVYTNTGDKIYTVCHRCNGTGELPMWNPVIPKSAISGGR